MADMNTNEIENAVPVSDENQKEKISKKGKNILKLGLFVGGPVLILSLGIVSFLMLTDMGRKILHKDKQMTEKIVSVPENIVFFSVPELTVNLIPEGRKAPFLRLGIKLELPDAEAEKTMTLLLPRITDQFQLYLRELRVEDIEGSAGIHRLKEELLKRVNTVTQPIKVKDVLFEVMLVQ